MIDGAHVVIYSRDAEADRTFLRNVLGFPYVDVGHGWLIFALPPAEVAVHPAEPGGTQQLYLMCRDIEELRRAMGEQGIACSEVQRARWGLIVELTLPGGGQLSVYQPLHERPPAG